MFPNACQEPGPFLAKQHFLPSLPTAESQRALETQGKNGPSGAPVRNSHFGVFTL